MWNLLFLAAIPVLAVSQRDSVLAEISAIYPTASLAHISPSAWAVANPSAAQTFASEYSSLILANPTYFPSIASKYGYKTPTQTALSTTRSTALSTALPSVPTATALSILLTAVPTSLVNLDQTNKASFTAVIASEFAGSSEPAWFTALPANVQTFVVHYSATSGGAGLFPTTVFRTIVKTAPAPIPTTPTPLPTPKPESTGLSTGAEAGIGAGVGVAVLAVIVGIITFCCLRMRKRKREQAVAQQSPSAMAAASVYPDKYDYSHQHTSPPSQGYPQHTRASSPPPVTGYFEKSPTTVHSGNLSPPDGEGTMRTNVSELESGSGTWNSAAPSELPAEGREHRRYELPAH